MNNERGRERKDVHSLPESTASLICHVSSKLTKTRTSILRCIALFITTSIRGCTVRGEDGRLSPLFSLSLLSPSAGEIPPSAAAISSASGWPSV